MLYSEKYEQKRHPEGALLGHGWNPEMWDRQNGEEMLEEKFPNKAVIIFRQIVPVVL